MQIGRSLNEMGEAMREMAEVKYALEDNVKQNFLEPLHHLQAKDLKDVMVSVVEFKNNKHIYIIIIFYSIIDGS